MFVAVAWTLYILWIAFAAGTIVVGWRVLCRRVPMRRDAAIVLAIVSLSLLWLVLGLFVRGAIGSDYSDRRFATIGFHLALLGLAAILAIVRGRELRWWLLAADLPTVVLWLYVWVVSSVV